MKMQNMNNLILLFCSICFSNSLIFSTHTLDHLLSLQIGLQMLFLFFFSSKLCDLKMCVCFYSVYDDNLMVLSEVEG